MQPRSETPQPPSLPPRSTNHNLPTLVSKGEKQRFPGPTRTPGRGALRKRRHSCLSLSRFPSGFTAAPSFQQAASRGPPVLPARFLELPGSLFFFGPRSNFQIACKGPQERALSVPTRFSERGSSSSASAKGADCTSPTIINASPSFSQGGSSRNLRTEQRPLAGEGSRVPPCQPLATATEGLLPSLGASPKPRPSLAARGRNGRFWSLPGLRCFLAALCLSHAILAENYTRSTANTLSNTTRNPVAATTIIACGARPNCKEA